MSRQTTLHPRNYRRPGQEEEDAIVIDDENDDLMQIDAPETTTAAGRFQYQQQQRQQQQQQRMGYGMLSITIIHSGFPSRIHMPSPQIQGQPYIHIYIYVLKY